MKFNLILISAALAAAPFAVQASPVIDPSMSQQAPATAASATDTGVPASAATRDPNAQLGTPENPAPMSSPTPAGQAYQLKAGDPSVITNGPVPDTRANRARFGQPMSRAGRATDAAGN